MLAPHITITVASRPYENEDDCLTAAEEDYLARYGLDKTWSLEPRWVDDSSREEIQLRIPRHVCTIDYVWVPDVSLEGSELELWLAAAQEYCDAHEDDVRITCGDGAVHVPSVVVRDARDNREAHELYKVRADGTLQVLGYSVPRPHELDADLLDAAHDHAWTAVTESGQ